MANAALDENSRPTLTGVSSTDGVTIVRVYADPTTHRLLVDGGAAGALVYNDTVSGTINSINTVFTVPNTIGYPIALFLAGSPYQAVVDYTVSGTTITFVSAPNISLSGQPFWLAHT